MIRNISYYILLFFIYSFAGWLMESVGGIFKDKKFVNRGFLIGPYCPVYGCGVLGITILLSKYRHDIPALFVLSTVICGSLEYFTSYTMEKLFKARWWDYHNRKFNINGRICLETLIPFGIAGTVIVCLINPFIISIFDICSDWLIYIFTTIFAICFVIDFIISFKIILSFKGNIYKSKDNTEEISNKVKEKTEEISNKVKEKTEEISEEVRDRAETTIMNVESNAITFRRRIKAKNLVFKRKVKYTRKQIKDTAFKSLNDLTDKSNQIRKNIEDKRNQIDNQIKAKQKEISNQIIERFKKQSVLSRRLMDAFPKLSIKDIYKKDNKQKK